MSDLHRLVQSNVVLLGLDAAFAKVDENHRGWFLVDARTCDLPTLLVHARPWLRDPGEPARLRVEGTERVLDLEEVKPGYGIAFVTDDRGGMDSRGMESLALAIEAGKPLLRVRFAEEPAEASISFEDGRWEPLPDGRGNPRPVERLSIELQGHGRVRCHATLPANVSVHAGESEAVLGVRVSPGRGFRAASRRVRLSAGEGLLDRGSVLLDVDLHPAGDRLAVSAEGFAPSVAVTLASRSRRARRWSAADEVHLHVLYDRTMLDLELWPAALATVQGLVLGEAVVHLFAESRDQKEDWNLATRQQVVGALREQINRLHRRVKIDLWWFADRPQRGIEPPEGLPLAPQPCGHAGVCGLDQLEEALGGAVFGYANGLDFFDAVDELLKTVANAVESERREQHAVLIVGDSPPPPADEQDPLWQLLVDRPPRTNTRKSPLFRKSLRRLAQRRAPVGWLFIRHAQGPAKQLLHQDPLALYQRLQTLREDTLEALRQTPGLMVESGSGRETLPGALSSLFSRMNAVPEPTGLNIENVA